MDQVKAFLQEQVDEEIQKLVDAGHGVADEEDEFTPGGRGIHGELRKRFNTKTQRSKDAKR